MKKKNSCVNECHLLKTLKSCKDVNECNNGRHNCDKNAYCLNLDGGFRCICNSGFTGDGVSCHAKVKMALYLLLFEYNLSFVKKHLNPCVPTCPNLGFLRL